MSKIYLQGDVLTAADLNQSFLDLKTLPINTQTTTYTLVLTDLGTVISATGSVDIPASVFASGSTVSIFNNSAAVINIIQAAGLTLYNASTGVAGSFTLNSRGICSVIFVSPTVAVLTGVGVSVTASGTLQGPVGPAGTGFAGSRGVTGFTGSFGTTGFTGSVGYTGSFGTTGFTGSFGTTGFTGSFGTTGFTGSGGTGFTGSVGASGSIGAWTLIQTQTASASASIDFTGLSGYSRLRLSAQDISVSSTATDHILRLSSDNGVTFISSSSYNNKSAYPSSTTATGYVSSNDGFFALHPPGNGTYAGLAYEMLIENFNIAQRTILYGPSSKQSTGATERIMFSSQTGLTAMNAIRILQSSGTITTGTFILEGIVG